MRKVEGLLPRLLKYASSDGQRRKENFLTEILTEFLNVLAKQEHDLHRKFIENVLLADCNCKDPKVLRQIEAAPTLGWKSQWGIDRRKSKHPPTPDLILFEKPDAVRKLKPLIVIENKLGAPLGKNQLPTYGKWLNSKGQNPDGALVFLTYATPPPDDFYEGKQYGVKTRATSLWVRVAEWLADKRIRSGPIGEYLRNVFLELLRSEGIVQMGSKEVDLLGRFFQMRIDLEKEEEDEENILDRAEINLVKIVNATKKTLKGEPAEYDYGALLCHKDAQDDGGIKLGWGFTSGGNKLWFPRNEGRGLVACAIVLLKGGDNPPLVKALGEELLKPGRSAKQTSSGWKKGLDSPDYPSWYITCPAQSLRNDTHGFTKAFDTWAQKRVTEAERFVKMAKAKASKAKTDKG